MPKRQIYAQEAVCEGDDSFKSRAAVGPVALKPRCRCRVCNAAHLFERSKLLLSSRHAKLTILAHCLMSGVLVTALQVPGETRRVVLLVCVMHCSRVSCHVSDSSKCLPLFGDDRSSRG